MLRKFAFSALLSTMLCCVITTSNALADGMPIPAPGSINRRNRETKAVPKGR